MPGPRAAQNVQMPHPTPGTDKASKCPAVAEGGEGGLAQMELTDA